MNNNMNILKQATAILSVIIFAACNNASDKEAKTETDTTAVKKVEATLPSKESFHQVMDGKQVDLYFLKNKNNMQAMVTNYGGRLVSLIVPDKNNKMTDVVLGFDSVQQYRASTEAYFGATIGRFGNRIAKGKFVLDGKSYSLFTNNGPNTLHGGKKGFQDVVWDVVGSNDSSIQLSYLSKDGEENFPGNLTVNVTYTLQDDNTLKIDYEAKTDKKTIINLTNHAFFNLNGQGSGSILNHVLQINADKYTPADSTLIATGKIDPVANTPYDFTKPTAIGARIEDKNEQLKNGNGYDINYVLGMNVSKQFRHAATVTGDKSGIIMDVYTVEPGLQFYTGNFMRGKNTMKGGSKDEFRTAFCLETQHFPDAPNKPNFPSPVLKPGEVYKSTSLYRFSAK
ncbi:MAG: galactose mutarotase [Bacteroidetes bacterium]|nr:galactose mutarotase [Bacteroidota bacterium]